MEQWQLISSKKVAFYSMCIDLLKPQTEVSAMSDILLAKVTPKLIGIENPWNCLRNLETICIPSVWHTSRTTLHDYSREQDVV